MRATIYIGDVMERLRDLRDECVQCVVTSPPYWGLRDYQTPGQLGLENTPEEYIARMVEVFREVRRVLRGDGTLWLNLGDSYAAGKCGRTDQGRDIGGKGGHYGNGSFAPGHQRKLTPGLKPKDLCGIPWMLAFALRADGWWLRQDIIWSKPNPMPESVKDRCCKSHEYLFLLTKNARYYFDSDAIAEPAAGQEKVGSKVQPDREGAGSGATLLLLREGAAGETGLPGGLQAHSRATGSIQGSGAAARARGEVHCSPEEIRPDRQRTGSESGPRQTVCEDREGPILQAEDGDQAETSDRDLELHSNAGTMAGDKSSTRPCLRVLQEVDAAAGDGSCDSAIEGRQPHEGQHRASVSEMQCEEGEPQPQRVRLGREGANSRMHQDRDPSHPSTRKVRSPAGWKTGAGSHGSVHEDGREKEVTYSEIENGKRNKRSVWEIATQPFAEAHFATFPEKLVEPCILAGSKEGDVVLDPFCGSGTTGVVALRYHRDFVGIELNPEYAEMAERRIGGEIPLFAGVEVVRPKLAAVAGD